MEAFSSFITSLENWIWGAPMLILLCGTHIFMTLRTGFIQKKTFTGIRLSVTKDPDSPGDVSQFQALTTALASTIGTGNIIGVGTAIYLGGPGAVLWCWLTGVFGIATKYAESLIAVKYRVKTADGRMMGGAMYALERGLKWKKFGKVMAVLFALFAMLASFGIGCGTQINAIAEVMETNLPIGIPRIVIGIVFGIVTAIIILGGIMTGYFSPTEAAAVATAYALIVGLFIYHELDLKSIWEAFVNASKSTGQILIIVALASLFSWIITVAQVPQTVSAFLQANIHSKVAMLLLINVILLIAGTFIDTTSAIVIFAPLFIPICNALNIDLVHFGMIMAVNLTIGMCTPPLGVCLFVSSSIAKISLKDQMRDLLPMLAVLIGVLLLVTYIPGLTLWLPSLFK